LKLSRIADAEVHSKSPSILHSSRHSCNKIDPMIKAMGHDGLRSLSITRRPESFPRRARSLAYSSSGSLATLGITKAGQNHIHTFKAVSVNYTMEATMETPYASAHNS
jgi:hypothetical protein